MAWKRLVLGAIGGLAVLSLSWNALAEQVWAPPSAIKKAPEAVKKSPDAANKTSAGAKTSPGKDDKFPDWRPAGAAPGSRGIVRRFPPLETASAGQPGSQSSKPPAKGSTSGESAELVVERYDNGAIKSERQVKQDAQGNFVNHGTYTLRDPDGRVVRSGQYVNGKKHGSWTHRFDHDEGHLFSERGDGQFIGPFLSEATFDNGRLHGVWSVTTAGGRHVIEWAFDQGNRHGKSTWWYANGKPRLEATYQQGVLHGEVLEWGPDGQLAKQGHYDKGRYLAKKVEWYAPGKKHFEGYALGSQAAAQPKVDWWKATAAGVEAIETGRPVKHGLWTAWYRNGNKQSEGRYEYDQPTGKFVWWYENGQKQAQGSYQAGAKDGVWITWHPNGMKESQTDYRQGLVTGKWMHWNAEGKLVEVRDLSEKREATVQSPKAPAAVSQRPAAQDKEKQR